MIKDDKIELYKKAIATYGKEAQIGIAFEEMGELIVALNHYKRDRSDVQSIKEFIKSRNLQKEYVERQEELSDACYDMTSDTDLSYIRFTQPNLDCDLDVFIKELQAIKKKRLYQEELEELNKKYNIL